MLQINYQTSRIVVDRLPVACHWSVKHIQTSYHVTILKDDSVVHELTGVGDSTDLLLTGFELSEYGTYTVRINSCNSAGSMVSLTNSFITGNLGNFHGNWIAKSFQNIKDKPEDSSTRNTVLRKCFPIQNAIDRAVINIAGLGFYNLYINGDKVSRNELNTDWTNYSKTIYYDTYEIKDYLKTGGNTLIIELGNGWYAPSEMKLFGKYNLRDMLCSGVTQAIADIFIQGEGLSVRLSTDETWECTEGAYFTNNIYLGETLDSRLFSGRNTTELVSPRWNNVLRAKGPQGQMVSSYIPKIEKIKCLDFKEIHVLNESEFIVDFGETLSGLIDLSVSASEGQVITLTYAECLDDDYTLNTGSTLAGFIGKEVAPGIIINGGESSPGRAEQIDQLICRSGINHLVNKYTYHSFRYVKVSGMNLDQLLCIMAHKAYSKLESAGDFLCSDLYLNRLYEIARNTKLNNIHSVFSDCARERFAYGGDIVALAKSQVYQFNSAKMYEKTLSDFINDTRKNGGFPETAPFVGIKTNGTGETAGPLGWQLVVPFLLNIHYQHYGTLDLARAFFPFLERQLEHLNSVGYEGLLNCCLGDWGSRNSGAVDYKSGSPARNFTTACIYYLHVKLLHKFSTILKLNGKSEFYAKQIVKIRDRIIADFRNADDSFADKSQTSYVFALYMELSDNPKKLASELANAIRDNNYLITCGIFGQSFLYEVLRHYDENEVIMKWLHACGGFKSMLHDEDTTLKEFFGDNKNGSCNHAMFSSYTSWMTQGPGGIIIEDNARGSDSVRIQPAFLDSLQFVDCTHHTVRGYISCKWQRLTKGIEIVINIPFNLKKCVLVISEEYNVTGNIHEPQYSDGVNQYFDIRNAGEVSVLLT